jgi:hypothetical protein
MLTWSAFPLPAAVFAHGETAHGHACTRRQTTRDRIRRIT